MQRVVLTFILILFTLMMTHSIATTLNIPAINVVSLHDQLKHTGVYVHFKQKEIKQQTHLSITDFLNQQGLIQVTHTSNLQNQTNLSIHGFGSNAGSNVLVLINGVPLTSFTRIGPNLNSLLIHSIQQIIIWPGSYGTLYGDQAIGGVVNFITDISDKNQTELSLSLGNKNQYLGQFYFNHLLSDHLKFSLGGLIYHTDHNQSHNKQNDYNINTQWVYNGQNNKLHFILLSYKNTSQIPEPNLWPRRTAIYHITDNYIDNHGLTILINNKWILNQHLSWQSSISTQQLQSTGKINFPFNSHQENELWQNRWHYDDWFVGGFNLQTQHYRLLSRLQNNRVSSYMSSVFGQITRSLLPHLKWIIGSGYAHQSIEALPTPSQLRNAHSDVLVDHEGLLWQFHHNGQFYLRRDTNYRFAKADEKIWMPGNVGHLKTQIGEAYEAGIQWHYPSHSLLLNLYRLDLNNEIAFNPQPTPEAPFGNIYNLPPTRRLGIDAATQIVINRYLNLNIQLSAVDAFFTSGPNQGKHIPTVSAVHGSISISFHSKHHWSLNLSESYHSPWYAAYDLSNKGNKMPSYFLTNLHLQKQWHTIGLGLQINNLFNTHYPRFAQYVPAHPSFIEFYPAEGINILINMNIKL